MNKSVFAINTPESCEECRLMAYEEGCVLIGPVGGHHGGRSEDCPLRPLPEKKEMTDTQMKSLDGLYVKAWNECLDEITGEDE